MQYYVGAVVCAVEEEEEVEASTLFVGEWESHLKFLKI